MAKKTKDFSQQVGGILSSALTPEPEPEVMVNDVPLPTRRFGSSSVKTLTPLTTAEAAQLARLEATIDRGMNTFLDVGRALIEIQENKLYRATHLTIEQYMLERFSLNRNRGYQLIEAAKVVNQIAEEIKSDPVEATDASSTEGYQAVPTGKVRRSKPSPSTAKQPEDVDYTEESGDGTNLAEPADAETAGQASGPTSYVWSAPEEGKETGEQGEGELSNGKNTSIPLPNTESHAAALAQLPEDQRTTIWKKTVAESQQDGKPITASRIKKTAEKGGVPLNKKAPKDRAPAKNAVGNNPDANDDFSDAALEHTRQAMNNPTWIAEETKTATGSDLGEEESVEVGEEKTGDAVMDVAPVGSRQALSEALSEKIVQALPGEIMITLRGSFLIREGLSESWQTLRGDDRAIDEQYSDTLTIQEFWDLIGAKR
ncbi:hypothetical protein [Spirosoma jeollabukense]